MSVAWATAERLDRAYSKPVKDDRNNDSHTIEFEDSLEYGQLKNGVPRVRWERCDAEHLVCCNCVSQDASYSLGTSAPKTRVLVSEAENTGTRMRGEPP